MTALEFILLLLLAISVAINFYITYALPNDEIAHLKQIIAELSQSPV